jgi:hypothetical protein
MIQDVNATTPVCMNTIRDLNLYPSRVPYVKSVSIYDSMQFPNVRTFLLSVHC